MNKKDIIILVLVSIILISALVGGFFYIKNKYTNQGFQSGYNQAVINLVSQISQTGNIPMFSNQTGQIQIKSIPISQICQGT